MLRSALVLAGLLMLGGCASLVTLPKSAHPLVKAPASATEAIAIAQDMVERGRWSDAVAVIESAARQFPDDRRLGEELNSLQLLRDREIRDLEDLIMVGDAENQSNKIALLERMSRLAPDNLIVMSRRMYWKEVLASKAQPLAECAELHVDTNAALARRCFHLASVLETTPKIEQRLAAVNEQLRASEDIAEERRRANEHKQRQLKAKVLLDNAKGAIEARDYRRALDILERVAALQPNNREIAGLQEKAWSMISPQVEALVKLGDHLYLDEQLNAAVATWQAALSLKPDDEDILARIERAQTVLGRLDALRRQQKSYGDFE